MREKRRLITFYPLAPRDGKDLAHRIGGAFEKSPFHFTPPVAAMWAAGGLSWLGCGRRLPADLGLSWGRRLPADLGWLLGGGKACDESGAYLEAFVVDPPASRDFYDVVRSPREKDMHLLSWEELLTV